MEYTLQSVYNAGRNHLLSMDRKATDYPDGSGMCKYRTHDGRKCVVGSMIPDEEYQAAFEGVNANTLGEPGSSTTCPTIIEMCKVDEMAGLLLKMQRIHDNSPLHEWVEELDELARHFHLQVET